jgi:hypothetical protein
LAITPNVVGDGDGTLQIDAISELHGSLKSPALENNGEFLTLGT